MKEDLTILQIEELEGKIAPSIWFEL